MIQPIQYNVISFKSNSHLQPIEKSVDLHHKLILNGYRDNTETNKSRIDYLYSEIDEFKQAVTEGNRKDMEEEIGDVIFGAILLADDYGINPVDALNKTNKTALNIKNAKNHTYCQPKILLISKIHFIDFNISKNTFWKIWLKETNCKLYIDELRKLLIP